MTRFDSTTHTARLAVQTVLGFAFIGAGLILLPVACAGGDGNVDAGVDAPDDHRAIVPTAMDAALGQQFLQPEIVIPVGEERMTCWVPDWVPDRDYLVRQFEGVQSPLGHHVVALKSGIARAPGTVFDCTNLETMTSLEPLILPDPSADEPLLPDGYAVKLTAGDKIVIQSHYVNYTDNDILTADVARFHFVPAADEPTTTPVSYFIANHGGINLPEGASSADIGCTLPDDVGTLNVIALLGHMHELGQKISVERTPMGGVAETIYSVDEWTVDFRDDPPLEIFSPTAPLVLSAGDHVNVHCEYDNDRGKAVTFPEEMCTSVGYYFPARPDGIVFCND